MDKSTGKQVTTKARGNFVGLTFDGSLNNDGSGRLLEESWCHATYNMSDAQVDKTVFQFRRGTAIFYGTADGDGDHGEVDFIAGHHSQQRIGLFFGETDMSALPYDFPLDNPDGVLNTIGPILESHPETMCNIYAHMVCTSGETQETCNFFMMCCGTENQALFTTGNCCVIRRDADSDQRRLGKCNV